MALGLPAIVFTGNFDPAKRREFLARGVVDYVLKDNRMVYDYLLRITLRVWHNRRIKVLVVDDSFERRNAVVRFLLLLQMQGLTAANGEEALQQLRLHPDTRLVLTDHAMPGMDGFQLVTELRRLHDRSRLGVIGLSDDASGVVSARFLKLGVNDYLLAPYHHEEFFTRIIQNLETLELAEELEQLRAQQSAPGGDLRT